MRVRVCGQLSLADSLVRAPESGVLDRIAGAVDWAALEVVLRPLRNRRSDAGAPGYPPVLLLRCLLLGLWHGGLSDPALEAALSDRLSFRRFVGLSLDDPTPDHSTLWRFRAALEETGLAEAALAEINRQFEAKGLIVKQGTLIDASLVPARARPRRRTRRGEERPAADPDAAWGAKNALTVFGYKIHIGVDQAHTLIRSVAVSDASVTDTELGDRLVCGDEAMVLADQGYSSKARRAWLKERGIRDGIMMRPNKHHPVLAPWPKRRNRLLAQVRFAVERPFAVFKEQYGLRRMRFFTQARNHVQVLLACCAYNLRRAVGVGAA